MSEPDNVVDLDEYRRRRTEEGTWPPDEETVREYWKGRRNRWSPPPSGTDAA